MGCVAQAEGQEVIKETNYTMSLDLRIFKPFQKLLKIKSKAAIHTDFYVNKNLVLFQNLILRNLKTNHHSRRV